MTRPDYGSMEKQVNRQSLMRKEGRAHPCLRACPSERGIEGRGPIVPVKVAILDATGRCSGGPRLGEIRGQTETPDDSFHRTGLFDERKKPQPAATARTLEHVEPKRPSHQIGPENAPGRCGDGRSLRSSSAVHGTVPGVRRALQRPLTPRPGLTARN